MTAAARKLKILLILTAFMLAVSAQILFAAPGQVTDASNGASQNGWLHVNGTQLVNEQGHAVVLHGMSSHGLQWFAQYTTRNAIGATAAYGANLFRVAMYTKEGGYLSHKSAMTKKLYAAVVQIPPKVFAAYNTAATLKMVMHMLSDNTVFPSDDELKLKRDMKNDKRILVITCIRRPKNGWMAWKRWWH